MNTDVEGMAVANNCILMSLLATLARKSLLAPDEIGDLMGEAEEYLAGLRPDMMSTGAREYARKVIQAIGKIA